ncbi:MAG: tetratricopeptide repeat protein [Phycisphaerales bacterium]
MPIARTIPSAALALSLVVGIAGAPAALAHASALNEATSASDLADALIDREQNFTPDDPAAAKSALVRAMDAEPNNATWPLALGILTMRTGDAADAEPYLDKAVDLAPDNPDALNWHANMLFATINDASIFAKGRMAGKARDQLQRAVEIDPSYVDARIALIEFYRQAPGIAGGSKKKAREHAEALTKFDAGKIHGHRLLAQIAMQDDDWDEANRQALLAAEAASTGETRARMLMVHAYGLLTEKEDPAAALPIAKDAYETLGPDTDDFSTVYVYARALAETGDCAAAVPLFERVLVLNEGAKTTRYMLAECLAKQGQTGKAIAMYEEFLERFPSDDLAKDAKKALRSLGK